jgi:hypothetical protein
MATNVLISEEGNSPVALYNDFGIAAGQAHLLPLLGRWARLRPHLEPFVRGGKLAPSAAEPF